MRPKSGPTGNSGSVYGIPDAVDSQRHHVLTPEDVPGVAAARHRGDLAPAQSEKNSFKFL
jgi:hypothetical protein